jgi:hypothetical protein
LNDQNRLSEREMLLMDWIRQETDRFVSRFPEPDRKTPALSITWESLERQLESLAGTPQRKTLVEPLLSATRKQAWCKPPEMVLREILVIAGVLQDENFQPGEAEIEPGLGGGCPMT